MLTRARRRPRGVWSAVPLGAGLLLTCVLALVTVVGRFVVPVVLQQVLDGGRLVPRMSGAPAVWWTVGVGALVVAGSVGAAFLLHSRMARRSEILLDVMRRRAFRVKAPDPESRDRTVAEAVDHVEHVSQFVRWSGPAHLTNGAALAVAAAVMFVYSWALAAAVVLAFVLLVVTQRRFARRQARLRRSLQELGERVQARIVELVSRAEDGSIRALRLRAAADLTAVSRDRDREELRSARLDAAGSASAELAVAAAVVLTVVGGAVLGRMGDISEGRLAAFVLVLMTAVAPAQAVVAGLVEEQRAAIGWRRVLGAIRQRSWAPVAILARPARRRL
ncbi:ABC transporter transmembrane domain-containing protein [Dactylosporangium sp. NPDC049140]|uniref:ABC transporter transmembrane domain-containing protein n=1 Tax=Dactylosporangium sp. NPDC049140 TaxID=3155647 RepID=UPI0033C9F68C